MHQCHEAPLLFGDDRIGDIYVRIEYGFDILGINVLAAGAYDHILQAPLDIKPAVLVELAQIARAEPAVIGKDLFRRLGVLEIPEHDAGRQRHDLALPGVGVDMLQAQLHARRLGPGRAEAHLRRCGARQQRRGLGKPVADGIRDFRLQQELFGTAVEFGAPDAEEPQTPAEELEQFLARDAVEVAAQESHLIERTPETVGIEFGQYLVAVDLLDDERHDQHDRGTHGPQRRHQCRGRGRTVEVNDPGTHREGIDHTDGTFVGVRERQHREEYVVGQYGKDARRNPDLGAECRVGQHHPLGLRGRTRGIDDHGQVIGLRHGHGALPPDPLSNDAQVLGAHHDVQPFDGLFREFGKEPVGNEQGLGFGMRDDHVEFLTRKIGQDRHGDHAGRSNGEIADSPIGHVAAEQGNLVPGTEPRTGKYLLHFFDTPAHLGIGHVVAFEHRKCDFRRELLHAVADQFVKCIDGHNTFRFNYVSITRKFGAKLLISG